MVFLLQDDDDESNAGLVTAMKDLEIAPLEEEVKDDADDASFAKKRRKVKGKSGLDWAIVRSRYRETCLETVRLHLNLLKISESCSYSAYIYVFA